MVNCFFCFLLSVDNFQTAEDKYLDVKNERRVALSVVFYNVHSLLLYVLIFGRFSVQVSCGAAFDVYSVNSIILRRRFLSTCFVIARGRQLKEPKQSFLCPMSLPCPDASIGISATLQPGGCPNAGRAFTFFLIKK